jgi:hypothetical protein
MNAHWVNDVRQAKLHTAETPLSEQSDVVFDVAIEKLKKDTNHQVWVKSQQK